MGEYDIVVLSATDATALDTWLHQNGYKIPDGAGPYLRPYVEMGMKFFVAKVDVSKVKFERIGNGPEQAALAAAVSLRLGRLQPARPPGPHQLGGAPRISSSTSWRGASATRSPTTTTSPSPRTSTSRTPRGRSSARSTRRSSTRRWQAPARGGDRVLVGRATPAIPAPPLRSTRQDLVTLGADVMPGATPPPPPGGGAPVVSPATCARRLNGFVVTRLHARYSKDALGDNLFFRAGAPHRGRARVHAGRQQARAGRAARQPEQLPGALRHPSPVDGAHRVRAPAARRLGRTSR